MNNQSPLTPEERRLLNEEGLEISSEYGQGRTEAGAMVCIATVKLKVFSEELRI